MSDPKVRFSLASAPLAVNIFAIFLCLAACGGPEKEGPTPEFVATPTKALLENAVQVVVDEFATCALDSVGATYCWGYVEPFTDYKLAPARLGELPPIAQIGSGFTTILLGSSGDVFLRGLPNKLDSPDGEILSIPSEGQKDCLLIRDGQLACAIWQPYFKAVTETPAGLIQIVGNPGPGGSGVGLYSDGSVLCTGAGANYCDSIFRDRGIFPNEESEGSLFLTGAPPARYVSMGCLIGTDGRVYCWGENGFGQLGTGAPGWFDGKFRPVLHVKNAIKVQANNALHRCALTESKQLWCWGGNQLGQIGNGRRLVGDKCIPFEPVVGNVEVVPYNCPGEYEPVMVLEGVRDFALDLYHTCAVLEDGQVFCWGDQRFGKLGNGVNVGN